MIDWAASGEEIVIARAGKHVARLMPLNPASQRVFGALLGQLWVSDDFDDADDELTELFEGRGDVSVLSLLA